MQRRRRFKQTKSLSPNRPTDYETKPNCFPLARNEKG